MSRHGRALASFGHGFARENRSIAPDDLVIWLSSVKPVTAVALALAWEEGLLELDDPVAAHLPRFGAHGKERVTLRHLLTHTAGLRNVEIDPVGMSWDAIVAAVCDAPMEAGWEPGKKAGYHRAGTWFVLADVVQRVVRRPFAAFVRESLYEPWGMTESWIGIPRERAEAYLPRLVDFWDTSPKGKGARHPSTDRERVVIGAPSGNAWGPVRELGWFYEALLGRGERHGRRVLSSQAVEALTAPHRVGMYDETFRHAMDWGLGFIVNTLARGRDTQPYGFGIHAGPRAFGHGGWQSSVAIADPDAGLVAAVVANGTPGEGRHAKRVRDWLTAVYEDLGLALLQFNLKT